MARTEAQTVNYTVPEPIFIIKQPTDNICWATVAAMLTSWKAGQLRSIEDTMQSAGSLFVTLFQTNTGLGTRDKASFLRALHLTAEPPATYTAPALESKLRLWGPLWITTAEGPQSNFSIHARVLTGIMGDGSGSGTTLIIADPADGSKHLEKLHDFTSKMETLARSDYGDGADVRPLIVHF
jgi:hypothetical protein